MNQKTGLFKIRIIRTIIHFSKTFFQSDMIFILRNMNRYAYSPWRIKIQHIWIT